MVEILIGAMVGDILTKMAPMSAEAAKGFSTFITIFGISVFVYFALSISYVIWGPKSGGGTDGGPR